MGVEIKFCGLTRPADVLLGASLGAHFLGVVFAESPRRVNVERAREVFALLAGSQTAPRRVGVFGATRVADIVATATAVHLDVVQLHADPSADDVRSLGDAFGGEIWATRRVERDQLPDDLEELSRVADRVLLDARPANGTPLGGSGRRFDWEAVAEKLRRRPVPRLVVAGGLTPENVALAIELFEPSVVDVSSGIELSAGIKDEARMRAFARAVGASNR